MPVIIHPKTVNPLVEPKLMYKYKYNAIKHITTNFGTVIKYSLPVDPCIFIGKNVFPSRPIILLDVFAIPYPLFQVMRDCHYSQQPRQIFKNKFLFLILSQLL